MKKALPALAVLAAACVPVPEAMLPRPPATTVVKGVFPDLDPGAAEAEALHFVVRAYGPDRARAVAEAAEADYTRIMQDTGLYSFRPGEPYRLVVYADPEEYHLKTQMPRWSGGATVGNAIYACDGLTLRPTLAHEMAHLIFNEYMVRPRPELRWLNEGLAVYQEMRSSPPDRQTEWSRRLEDVRRTPIGLELFLRSTPPAESEREAAQWYHQAASLTGHLIEKGGRLGFESLLEGLKGGAALDAALAQAFPGLWTSADALFQDWVLR